MFKLFKDKNKIILLGAGGHANSSIDVIESTKEYEIIGLFDHMLKKGTNILGYPIIGKDEDILDLVKKNSSKLKGIVTIGQIKSSEKRIYLYNILKNADILSPAITSPNSYISKRCEVGNGTMVFHGAILNALSDIGENCIINSNSLIEHGVKIGSHCHISTGVKVNGDVIIGEGTFIGSGTNINEGVKIGSNCIIGMGQNIYQDIEANSIISLGKIN